jgi:hypothetical protein
MPVETLVPLAIDPHDSDKFWNIPDFMNSLFFEDVRDPSVITDAIAAGSTRTLFVDDNSAALILRSWLAAWQHSQNDPYDSHEYARCPKTDRKLIAFLAGYIKDHDLRMVKPKLTATDDYEPGDHGARLRVYYNAGYESLHFLSGGEWNYGEVHSNDPLQISKGSYAEDTVVNFLFRMMCGTHFVVPSTKGDQKDGNGFTSFQTAFSNASLTERRTLTSHYAGLVANTSCLNYLDIEKDEEPSSNPLIAAFVLGPTTDLGGGNTFFQLEGWPIRGGNPLSGRHKQDFDTYKATLWNISTFGACAFSEKRSTPIFLARSKFDTTIHSDTQMPHYDGAGSKQGWMHTNLLTTDG